MKLNQIITSKFLPPICDYKGGWGPCAGQKRNLFFKIVEDGGKFTPKIDQGGTLFNIIRQFGKWEGVRHKGAELASRSEALEYCWNYFREHVAPDLEKIDYQNYNLYPKGKSL